MPTVNRNTLLLAAVAGAIYLICQIILAAMDADWIMGERDWSLNTKIVFATLTVMMLVSYVLFFRGFIALTTLFPNPLLKTISIMLIISTAGVSVLDLTSLAIDDPESLWLAYAATAMLFGALSIALGVGLTRLQDGMGELCRVAGILEIVTGCLLVTVVLFFVAFVIMVPAVVVEILILIRGYEYLSKSSVQSVPA